MIRHEGKVFGLGLGRTGTRTLATALRILQFDTVLHVPGRYEDCIGSTAAIEGAVLNHWPALYALYPDAKFILTVRSDVFTWLTSSERAMEQYSAGRFSEFSEAHHLMVRNRMHRWGCLEYDRKIMHQHYLDHNSRVREFFRLRNATDRLLQYRVESGWSPLCEFLGVPEPADSFPREQDEKDDVPSDTRS